MIPVDVQNQRTVCVVDIKVAAVFVCLNDKPWAAADTNRRTRRCAQLFAEWAANKCREINPRTHQGIEHPSRRGGLSVGASNADQ